MALNLSRLFATVNQVNRKGQKKYTLLVWRKNVNAITDAHASKLRVIFEDAFSMAH